MANSSEKIILLLPVAFCERSARARSRTKKKLQIIQKSQKIVSGPTGAQFLLQLSIKRISLKMQLIKTQFLAIY